MVTGIDNVAGANRTCFLSGLLRALFALLSLRVYVCTCMRGVSVQPDCTVQ